MKTRVCPLLAATALFPPRAASLGLRQISGSVPPTINALLEAGRRGAARFKARVCDVNGVSLRARVIHRGSSQLTGFQAVHHAVK